MTRWASLNFGFRKLCGANHLKKPRNFQSNCQGISRFSNCPVTLQRENLHYSMTEQQEIKCSRWANHRTFKMGTFNLLAPCYKTIETRFGAWVTSFFLSVALYPGWRVYVHNFPKFQV